MTFRRRPPTSGRPCAGDRGFALHYAKWIRYFVQEETASRHEMGKHVDEKPKHCKVGSFLAGRFRVLVNIR
jgi:hypothetical protein